MIARMKTNPCKVGFHSRNHWFTVNALQLVAELNAKK